MRLCENARPWKWQGGAGAFRTMVVVLLLRFSLAKDSCLTGSAPQSIAQPVYQDGTGLDAGVSFMADLVQSFLNTVQPNTFPKDLILDLVKNLDVVQSDPDTTKAILSYQVGFLVCAAIGILYIVLMVLVGFFLACCRCCGNCGGRMYQKQTSSVHCRRRTLYWSATCTTIIILAGNICMFRSNETLKDIVDHSAVELEQTLDNLHVYLTAVPQQIEHVVKESFKTVYEVTENLNDIGPQLGTDIQRGFRGALDPAVDLIRALDQDAVQANALLNEANRTLARLQSGSSSIQANISAVKDRINQTISKKECQGCVALKPELQKVTVDTSIVIPQLSELQPAVDEVIKADLQSVVKEAEDYFNSIPQKVSNDTKDVVQSTKEQLKDIEKQISQVAQDFPISALNNVSDSLKQLRTEINKVTPELERANEISWPVGVAICCVVLLVVMCNVLGLVLGPLGLRPKADPTRRSCTANCGGIFLMMGAGFSFLFSWLFMVLVLLLFLLGGNLFTLVCRPWRSGELLKLIDTPGLIPGLELGPNLGLKINLTLTDIYSNCQVNKPLWTTLHLHEIIDLEDLLNVSKYTEEIQQHFENTDITLSTITLLNPEVQNQLRNFSKLLKDVNYTSVREQLNNISRVDLNTTADTLDMVRNIQPNSVIATELKNEARDLRQIQAALEATIFPQVQQLISIIDRFQATMEKINGTVEKMLRTVGAAQDFLNTNTTQIVKAEGKEFLDCQMGYFVVYADWAKTVITQQVGLCGPLARAVDSAETIICSNVIESLNAFWFSLGWCLMFFIPSIILSMKLAKYYRKMDYSDVDDNHIVMNHIPRANLKHY